jgi:hypothetical protein
VTLSLQLVLGHGSKLLACSNPQARMNLLRRDDLANEDVASQEIVVHRLGYNVGYSSMGEFDKGIVF